MNKLTNLKLSPALKSKLTGTTAHNVVRLLLLVHIVVTSYWPSDYVHIYQHLATRIVVALLVVGLLFWDIISGALLAILLVLTIQESKSRKTVPLSASVDTVKTSSEVKAFATNLKKVVDSLPTNTQKELIAPSVYGQPTAELPGTAGAYLEQIGDLDITKQINAGQGVQMVSGVPSVKVNMGQLSKEPMDNTIDNTIDNTMDNSSETTTTQMMPATGNTTEPTVNLGTEYDNPADKTMTENLKAKASSFITDQNLFDAQSNRVLGPNGAVPACAVESAPGIWNAQGFGGIARALDNEDCPHSFV